MLNNRLFRVFEMRDDAPINKNLVWIDSKSRQFKIFENGEWKKYSIGLDDVVTTKPQELSDEEKKQVRANIAAGTKALTINYGVTSDKVEDIIAQYDQDPQHTVILVRTQDSALVPAYIVQQFYMGADITTGVSDGKGFGLIRTIYDRRAKKWVRQYISGIRENTVSFSAQSLDNTQKSQARANIGALSSEAGAVTTDKIANSAVTLEKLAECCINTPKILDNAVTNAKIATGARNPYVVLFSTTRMQMAEDCYSAIKNTHANTALPDVIITYNNNNNNNIFRKTTYGSGNLKTIDFGDADNYIRVTFESDGSRYYTCDTIISDSNFLKRTGGEMTGTLYMIEEGDTGYSNSLVFNGAGETFSTDVTMWSEGECEQRGSFHIQVDADNKTLDANFHVSDDGDSFLSLNDTKVITENGGDIKGALTIIEPTKDANPATKGYVDNSITDATNNIIHYTLDTSAEEDVNIPKYNRVDILIYNASQAKTIYLPKINDNDEYHFIVKIYNKDYNVTFHSNGRTFVDLVANDGGVYHSISAGTATVFYIDKYANDIKWWLSY